MINKKLIVAFLLASIAVVGVMTGCQDAGTTVKTYAVNDELSGGFVVTYVDDAGGYMAERVYMEDVALTGDGTAGVAISGPGNSEVQIKVSGQFNRNVAFDEVTRDGVTLEAEGDNGTEDVDLQADVDDVPVVYYLNGSVNIGNNKNAGNTLTIAAGALIKGEASTTSPGLLIITRGSKINAVGTPSNPIVFTSDRSNPAPGDWGGIVINGKAPIQTSTGYADGEGSSGEYGGNNSADNSGTLQYVRVEYAGTIFTSENELNGIAFQGVGSGTTVDHIQIIANGDDGIEFFGGSVAVKYVVLTGNCDDSFDFDDGWTGSAQYVLIQHTTDSSSEYKGDKLIEGDGDAAKANALTGTTIAPAHPYLTNFTIMQYGPSAGKISLKESSNPVFVNCFVEGNISDNSGNATVSAYGLEITGTPSLTGDDSTLFDGTINVSSSSNTVSTTNYTLSGTSATASAEIPATDDAGNTLDQDGEGYIGAVENSSDTWWSGWTDFSIIPAM